MVTQHDRLPLIGIEEHFLTEEVGSAWHDAGVQLTDPSLAHNEGIMGERLKEIADKRLALMDETGLDVQVLSLTTPALHELQTDSVNLAVRCNNALAEAISRHPTRFQGFATLPVCNPDAAARELERCVKDLGFVGTMLCGRVGDDNLDHPSLAPVFNAAAEMGVPVLLHPRNPPAAVRETYYSGFSPQIDIALSTFALGWHYDAGLQFVRLVLSGIFDLHPDLQIILGHWGEVILFYADRLAAMDRASGLNHPFSHYLRHNLYVTASGMFNTDYLARALAIVGADRLLFSTDYPYQYRPGGDARAFLNGCGLNDVDKAKFAHGNWQRLTHSVVFPGISPEE